MKLVRANRGPANRNEAWACLMANLALPGSGSLAAGKSVGYFQLALAAVGFLVSIGTGLRLLQAAMGGKAPQPDDPFVALAVLWREIRWPLLGLFLFGLALLWGAITGMTLLSQFPKNPPPPPVIK